MFEKSMVQLTRTRETVSRPGLVLAAVAVVQFMVSLDLSVVNVGLPRIAAGLGFGPAGLNGWADYLRSAPEELTSVVNMFPDPDGPVEIHVAFAGDDPDEAAAALDRSAGSAR